MQRVFLVADSVCVSGLLKPLHAVSFILKRCRQKGRVGVSPLHNEMQGLTIPEQGGTQRLSLGSELAPPPPAVLRYSVDT